MQHTIAINQLAVMMAGLNLDIVDLAIFDFVKCFAHSNKCMKIQTEGGQYFWISHAKIIEELPILGISTGAGIIKRINKLIDAELLERHPNCEMMKKTFYRFGRNYDKMCFIDLNKSNEPTTNVEGKRQQSFRDTPNESLGYQYTNNQHTNNQVINTADGGLFPGVPVEQPQTKQRGTTEQLCLFANSKYSRYEEFAACFTAPEFANIDLAYYHGAVADWSAQKGKKMKDWIATARNFMRGDMEKNKLHTLQAANNGGFDYEGARKYLEMCNE